MFTFQTVLLLCVWGLCVFGQTIDFEDFAPTCTGSFATGSVSGSGFTLLDDMASDTGGIGTTGCVFAHPGAFSGTNYLFNFNSRTVTLQKDVGTFDAQSVMIRGDSRQGANTIRIQGLDAGGSVIVSQDESVPGGAGAPYQLASLVGFSGLSAIRFDSLSVSNIAVDDLILGVACQGTSVTNSLNNCVCPAAETDVDGAGDCQPLDTSIAACQPTVGTCNDGELQALIGGTTQLCFDQSGLPTTLELVSATGVTDQATTLGVYDVVQIAQDGDFVVSAALQCQAGQPCVGATIEWFVTGAAASCSATYQLEGAGFIVTRKRQVAGSGPPASTFFVAAGASGDPHIRGAQGQRFDFFGKSNEIYTLFSAPQFVVNMQLLAQGPADKFIDVLFVHFRNVTLRFDTGTYKADKMQARVNKQLTGVTDARVVVGPRHSEIELCDGHRIVIEQRVDTDKIDHKQRKFYHLDVKIDVPGCHNDFGGILGETYRCDGEFKWDRSREESFHVSTGHDVSKDSKFSPSAPCHDNAKVFAGRKIMSGNTGKKM